MKIKHNTVTAEKLNLTTLIFCFGIKKLKAHFITQLHEKLNSTFHQFKIIYYIAPWSFPLPHAGILTT